MDAVRIIDISGEGGPEIAAEPTDAELVGRVAAGEREAFEPLMVRYGSLVLGYLWGRVASEADREDLAQEIFLDAFRRIDELRRPERFGPWLMRITRSRLIDWQRRHWRRPWLLSLTPDPARPEAPAMPEPVDPGPGPGRQAAEGQLRRRVIEAIGRLGDRYRAVLYMRLIAEEPPHVIARRMGLKESTVRMRLKRGLEKLRGSLRRQGWNEGEDW